MENLARTKQIIYILLGIIVLGILIFFAFRYFAPVRAPSPTTRGGVTGRLPGLTGAGELGAQPTPEELKPGESLTISPEQKLFRITDFPAISPSLSKDEKKILYYKKAGGDLFSSDLDGKNQEKISNITIVGLVEALWSPARDRAAIFYLDQETLKGFLHIGTSGVATLPQDVKSFSWSPDGKSLAYLLLKDDRLNLIVADASARSPKTVFTTPLREAALSWITGDKISFSTAPSGFAEGFLYLFSRSSGAFQRVAGPFFGLTSLWSPDGSRVILTSTAAAGKNLNLLVRDSSGKNLFSLGAKTLPQKCVWRDTTKIYCALPRAISPDAVWPDDYLRGEVNTQDRVALLDLEKKEFTEVFDEGAFDISDLKLTKDGSHLIFVDRADGTLWSLKIR